MNGREVPGTSIDGLLILFPSGIFLFVGAATERRGVAAAVDFGMGSDFRVRFAYIYICVAYRFSRRVWAMGGGVGLLLWMDRGTTSAPECVHYHKTEYPRGSKTLKETPKTAKKINIGGQHSRNGRQG